MRLTIQPRDTPYYLVRAGSVLLVRYLSDLATTFAMVVLLIERHVRRHAPHPTHPTQHFVLRNVGRLRLTADWLVT